MPCQTCAKLRRFILHETEQADRVARALRQTNQELDRAWKENARLRRELQATVPEFVRNPQTPGG